MSKSVSIRKKEILLGSIFKIISTHLELLDDTLTIEIKISWWIMETKEKGAAKVENSDKRFHVWKAEIRRGR